MDEGQDVDDRWSAREVAQFLGVSVREIEALRLAGKLSAVKRWPRGWQYSSLSVMGYFEGLPQEPVETAVSEPQDSFQHLIWIAEELKELARERAEQEAELGEEDPGDAAPLIKMVNAIFVHAIDQGASDIYFEPWRRGLRVRLRLNGVLEELMPIPAQLQTQLTRRVMVMADIDLARLFVPQVGSIRLKYNNQDWGARVTALPSLYGHTLTARLVNAKLPCKGLDALGMLPEVAVPLEHQLEQGGGLFLFVGEGGSGTTTTAVAALSYLNQSTRAIYTIEQPIEYDLPGIHQIQLNPFRGHTLEKALANILKSRPDILFLGSIHDAQSAQAAVEASEAGITVLATLRTTRVPSVFMLLERYGIPRRTQARLLQCVVQQRLVQPPEAQATRGVFAAYWIQSSPEICDLLTLGSPDWKLQDALELFRSGPSLDEESRTGLAGESSGR